MSGPVNIGSPSEWQSLLSGTSVVVADFYADWCGPCKMIAPHYERLAKEYSRPKKMAFAKVNVDSQSTVAQTNGVSAMPTFKIFHNGACVDTIKGANPSALSEAVSKAAKLADSAGGTPGAAFKTPGRTLGGDAPAAARSSFSGFNAGGIFSFLVAFVGMYLVSLFSIDAHKAAEGSMFNARRPPPPTRMTPGGSGPAASGSRPAPKSSFRTLADLRSE